MTGKGDSILAQGFVRYRRRFDWSTAYARRELIVARPLEGGFIDEFCGIS